MSRNAIAELVQQYDEDLSNYELAAHERDLQQQERGQVRWICVYCGHEVPEEHSSHCGEVGHTAPMPPEDENEIF